MTTFAVTSVNSLLCQASTCFSIGSTFRCIRSTPTERQSTSENDFECFASTGVKTPGTMSPNLWMLVNSAIPQRPDFGTTSPRFGLQTLRRRTVAPVETRWRMVSGLPGSRLQLHPRYELLLGARKTYSPSSGPNEKITDGPNQVSNARRVFRVTEITRKKQVMLELTDAVPLA